MAAVGYFDGAGSRRAGGLRRASPASASCRTPSPGLLFEVGGFGVVRPGLTVNDAWWELFASRPLARSVRTYGVPHTNEGERDGPGPTSRGPLERRPRQRRRRRERCHERHLRRAGHHLARPHGGLGGQDEPGGAAGRGARGLLLDGRQQRAGEGRVRPGARRRDGRRRRGQDGCRLDRPEQPHHACAPRCRASTQATFQEQAEAAKAGCPISRAISGSVAITLDATLESSLPGCQWRRRSPGCPAPCAGHRHASASGIRRLHIAHTPDSPGIGYNSSVAP